MFTVYLNKMKILSLFKKVLEIPINKYFLYVEVILNTRFCDISKY